jgi:hypothetical protein
MQFRDRFILKVRMIVLINSGSSAFGIILTAYLVGI